MTPMCLNDLRRCFDGRVPAVIATSSANGTPNITYLTAVHQVDGERVALSNQFMSKTTRNLIENGFASLLLIDPVSYSEYRLAIRYERTERRGPIFERLRADVDKVAALTGMRDVFRLRTADVYFVEEIDVVVDLDSAPGQIDRRATVALAAVATLTGRLSRCTDLDAMVSVALDGLDDLFGIGHSSVLLVDESGERLYTLASHGFVSAGVGSEVEVGEGVVGAAARECRPVRVGGLRQMRKYANTVRRSFEQTGYVGPGLDIAPPTLDDAESRLAVPAIVRGELVGVLVADSALPVAFDESDEAALGIVATLIAEMVESERSTERAGVDDGEPRNDTAAPSASATPTPTPTATMPASGSETRIRFFTVDGSVFLDGGYLIRGVAGRVLWSLVNRYLDAGQVEFTHKEIRLDRSLDLPGFRDNLDTRLILLKRRLEEREAPIQMIKTGRGRFRLEVRTALRTELHD